jgi:hypothetical protein
VRALGGSNSKELAVEKAFTADGLGMGADGRGVPKPEQLNFES